jgi:predicted nucleic acid-binding protein
VARIVLDTDVVSLYRTGRLPPQFLRQVATSNLTIAFATAGELWKWALARRWGDARRGGLELFLDQALILRADLAVAKVWGQMTAGAQRRGRPRPLNDTRIAACCIEGGLPLLTLNRRDFADFAEHDGLVLLGG